MTQRRTSSKAESQALSEFHLKNGLRVVFVPSPRAPVVSVQVWVKTGSADETATIAGISHFIEHLVFKGTSSFGVGEIAGTVEAAGGELNAWTSFDETVFYVNVSKHSQTIALQVLSEMMGAPTLDPVEVDREREVVIEEIKRSNDSPSRRGSQLLFGTHFKKHPYGRPVIGFDKVVNKVSIKTIRRVLAERYSAKNMLLVVAGDFQVPRMRAQVEQFFAELPAHRVQSIRRTPEPAPERPRVCIQKSPFRESQLYIATPAPTTRHADVAALDVLAFLLGQGDSSRLVRSLRVDRDVVSGVTASSFTGKDPGLFSIRMDFTSEKSAEALQILGAELDRVHHEGFSLEEVSKAIANFEAEEIYSLETADGLGRKAGMILTYLGQWTAYEEFLERVRSLTPADVLRAWKKYVRWDRATIALLASEDSKLTAQDLRRWLADRRKAASVVTRRQALPKAPGVSSKSNGKSNMSPRLDRSKIEAEHFTLGNGLRVVVRRDLSLPIISVRAGFLGGALTEEARTGISELLGRVWVSGTKSLSETEIQALVDGWAGGLSAFGGRNSGGLSASILTRSESEMAALFAEVFLTPAISPQAFERERTLMEQQLRSRFDRPGEVVGRLFFEKMYAGHPYAKDPLGSKETLGALNLSDASAYLQKLHASEGAIVLSGRVRSDLWLKRFEGVAKGRGSGFRIADIPKHRGPSAPDRVFQKLDKDQTHVMVAHHGLSLSDPRRHALAVARAILEGQGGRLFVELRDKRSLAYSVGPIQFNGLGTGHFGAFIACSPEKATQAIDLMELELRKLASDGPTAEELDRAINYLVGQHDMGLQRTSSFSSSLFFQKLYGLPDDDLEKFPEQIQSVSANDVRKVMAEILATPSVTAAVGRTCPW